METSPLPARAGSGQTAMHKIIYPIFIAFALTGCVSGTTGMKLSESHPANPAASQADFPPLAPLLMADTNFVLMTTTSTNAPAGGQEHRSKPEAATPPKHEHH